MECQQCRNNKNFHFSADWNLGGDPETDVQVHVACAQCGAVHEAIVPAEQFELLGDFNSAA